MLGKNEQKLMQQLNEFRPSYASLAVEPSQGFLTSCSGTKILWGEDASETLLESVDCDIVIAAIVGINGLRPTWKALQKGARVLLANKESLVCGGELFSQFIGSSQGELPQLLPIDSEHASLYRLLDGMREREQWRKLLITASGGPFWDLPLEEFTAITPEKALRHPTWDMGAKISIDSATMVNKGLELIEAHWLFSCNADEIEAVIHPQSIIHGLIELNDGSLIAHLAEADMKGPIEYALDVAARLSPSNEKDKSSHTALSLIDIAQLEFFPLEKQRFPAFFLARKCLEKGSSFATVFNCANEVAVRAFLEKRIPFLGISNCIEEMLSHYAGKAVVHFEDIEQVVTFAQEVKQRTEEYITVSYSS